MSDHDNRDPENRNGVARQGELFNSYATLGRNLQAPGGTRPYTAEDVLIGLELLRRGLSFANVRVLTGVSNYTLQHWVSLAQAGFLERQYPNIREKAAQLNHARITEVIEEFARRMEDPTILQGDSLIMGRWEHFKPSTQH